MLVAEYSIKRDDSNRSIYLYREANLWFPKNMNRKAYSWRDETRNATDGT